MREIENNMRHGKMAKILNFIFPASYTAYYLLTCVLTLYIKAQEKADQRDEKRKHVVDKLVYYECNPPSPQSITVKTTLKPYEKLLSHNQNLHQSHPEKSILNPTYRKPSQFFIPKQTAFIYIVTPCIHDIPDDTSLNTKQTI